jgi:hypothetical protein
MSAMVADNNIERVTAEDADTFSFTESSLLSSSVVCVLFVSVLAMLTGTTHLSSTQVPPDST